MDDDDFLASLARTLRELPGVHAVALGGSRAQGNERPDSDWDLGIYYRGSFDPARLRDLGWPGEVSEIGGWGGGVFNGGAWLTVDGRQVDVHYRDLDDVEYRIAEAREGRFEIESLLFHLAGVPTYIVVAELALARVLRGELPRPRYPEALRRSAAARWGMAARLTLDHAARSGAPRGQTALVAGAIARGACQAAHADLAARGVWVTNEKTLLDRAGLQMVDEIVADLGSDPDRLCAAVRTVQQVVGELLDTAEAT